MKRLWLALMIITLGLTQACSTVETKDFLALQSQVYRNQRQIKELGQRLEESRMPMAEASSELAAMRQDLASLRGQVEETGYRLSKIPNAGAMSAEAQKRDAARQAKSDQRLARLEAYLGIKGPTQPAARAGGGHAASPARVPKSAKDVYTLGKRLYSQKSYAAARDRFNQVLANFPRNEYAPAAQYWIGESYYSQRKYEEAILAYNKVVKNYNRSSKVPDALLKQGMAFRALGDKRTARIVLTKLIKVYPKSSAARIARKVIRRLK